MRRPGLHHLLLGLAIFAVARPALAQDAAKGFQLNRYEPTPAGDWFFAVEHPWYSSTRWFAGGLTLNYGHDPLVVNRSSDGMQVGSIIGNQLVGHVDLAVSFLDRIGISATLPLTLYESGDAIYAERYDIKPTSGVVLGDPRVGLRVRLYNHHDRDAFAVSLGAQVWIPVGAELSHAGDTSVRGLGRLMLGGVIGDRLRWSFNGGYQYRPDAQLDPGKAAAAGTSAGQELAFGAAVGITNADRTFNIGPEVVLATTLSNAFEGKYTSFEALLGGQVLLGNVVQLGAAVGTGIQQQPGTPDFRVLARLAYAPQKRGPAPVGDRDHDGVNDNDDLCPDEPQGPHPNPEKPGCPDGDRDKDGVTDHEDKCPDEPPGANPDPERAGCPLPDRDKDGVFDKDDQCPDEPQGDHPNPEPGKKGCPDGDQDKDGVLDHDDLCPTEPAGAHPNPDKKGCPDGDRDKDGVTDHEDKCPDKPAGLSPDPDNAGCPLNDRDDDSVPDKTDACPDRKGAPDPDPKKNGCPGLVEVKQGSIVILQQVFFATDKDVILPKSTPVLTAVANVLKLTPAIKRVDIEGHTDNQGAVDHNVDLSQRRAQSVMKWLVDHGVAAERLESHGYGPNRPIADNKTAAGRAKNRRVDFKVVDPPQPEQPAAPPPAPAPAKATKATKKAK